MNQHLPVGFIILTLLIFLIGFCIADESPSIITYIQGGESIIANGTDGMMFLTVHDIIPYFHMADRERSSLIPVDLLTYMAYPTNAAIFLSGVDDESVSLIEVSNLSFSKDNTHLILHVRPIEFYEGEALKPYIDEELVHAIEMTGKSDTTAIYLEIIKTTPDNYINCIGWKGPLLCVRQCDGIKDPAEHQECRALCAQKTNACGYD